MENRTFIPTYRRRIRIQPETKDYGGKIRKGEEPWPPPAEKKTNTDSA